MRVYAHLTDSLWVGVAWLAQRTRLTREMEYVTFQPDVTGPVCVTLEDGRILCDFGPDHEHD